MSSWGGTTVVQVGRDARDAAGEGHQGTWPDGQRSKRAGGRSVRQGKAHSPNVTATMLVLGESSFRVRFRSVIQFLPLWSMDDKAEAEPNLLSPSTINVKVITLALPPGALLFQRIFDNISCRKVMFSQVSVWPRGGVYTLLDRHPL